MIRPFVSMIRNSSMIDRTLRLALVSPRELSYDCQRPRSFLISSSRRNYQRHVQFSTAASSETNNLDSSKARMEAGDAPAANDQLSEKQVQELLKTIENYKEKLASTEDKYKRQLAETENVRQRFQRQVEEAKTFGIQNFCKDLLEIADVLELATESVSKDDISKGDNAAFKQLYDGLLMTQTNLSKIFNKHGLVAVRPLGEKFNPNIHEAVFQVRDTSKEPGSVANVVKVGYLLHDRLLRPAKVGVYISS